MKYKVYVTSILAGIFCSVSLFAEPITREQLRQIELQYSPFKVQMRGVAAGSRLSTLAPFPEGTQVKEIELHAGSGTLYLFEGKYRVENVTSYEEAANKVIDTFFDNLGFERENTELQLKPGRGKRPWIREYARYYKGYPTEFGANFRMSFDKDFTLTRLINRYLPITGDKTVNFQMTIEEVKAKVREVMCGVDVCNEENSTFSTTPYLLQHHDGTIDELWRVTFEKTVEPSRRWSIDIDDGTRSVYLIRMPNPWYIQER